MKLRFIIPAAAFLLAIAALRLPATTHWERVMLQDFRLPRLVLTLMLGSGMALSGWVAQKATRNPLASPDILGVPAAASLGVLLVLSLAGAGLLASRTLPLAAAGSGVIAATLLFSLAGRRHQLDGSGLLLAGIALGSLLSAITFLIALNSNAATYQYAIAWLAGSLSRASWDYIWLLLPGWWLMVMAIMLMARRIAILALDDDIVSGLGLRPDRARRYSLCLGAALGAVCVGVGGNFAFLGFIAPHLVRDTSGKPGEPWLVCATGALLLLAADLAGQYVVRPGEVPAGIVIAVIGAPAFAFSLFRQRWLR